MEQLVDFKLSILLSLAGLLIYSLIEVGAHLKKFSLTTFWNDNKPFWIWAFTLQAIFAALIAFMPETAPSIKQLSGLDLSVPMAFLTSGYVLAKLANWGTSKTAGAKGKIGVKGNQVPTDLALILILLSIFVFA